MLQFVHYALMVFYGAVPVAVLLVAGRRARRLGHAGPIVSAVLAWLAGLAAGVSLLLLNATLMGGRFPPGEWARFLYAGVGASCALLVMERTLRRLAYLLGRVELDARGRPVHPARPRALLVLLAQRLAMLVLVVGYIVALLITLRPRARLTGDPSAHQLTFATADFDALDGSPVAGWWIASAKAPPAGRAAAVDEAELWGKRTVLLCHGVGSGKERMLGLAKLLADNGFNVLVFDFRAHGQSGGSAISFGARERLDVLGAVRWARANHGQESQRIYGLGVNTGAAALLAAAAEPGSPEGQAIDALVLYEPFARFRTLAEATADRVLPGPMSEVVKAVSLPIASLHAGADLCSFAPAELAAQVWPRPVLVVHGQGQTFVPTLEAMGVFQATAQPKRQFWPADNYQVRREAYRRRSRSESSTDLLVEMFREYLGTTGNVSEDGGVRYQTLRFLREVEREPEGVPVL